MSAGTRLGKGNYFWDDFTNSSLDTNKWTLNQTSSYPNNGPDNPGDHKVDYFETGQLHFGNSICNMTTAPTSPEQWLTGFPQGGSLLGWQTTFLTTEYSPDGVQAQTGDYLEVKAEFGWGSGTWPAFWTWANGGSEVDVFEFHPDNPNLLELSNHVGGTGHYYTNANLVAPGKWVVIGCHPQATTCDWYVYAPGGSPGPSNLVWSDGIGVGSSWQAYLNLNLSLSDGYFHPDPSTTENPKPQVLYDYVGIWR